MFFIAKMELGFQQIRRFRTNNLPAYICICLFVITHLILMITVVVILTNVAPEIKTTLTDVNEMLPEMERSLLELGTLLPEIKMGMQILEFLCMDDKNCTLF